MDVIKLFVPSFLFFIVIDFLWIGLVAKNLYASALGHLMKKTDIASLALWPAIFIIYVLIISGILTFVLPKSGGNYLMGLLWGALFGLIVYGVYDLTNYAILANWPLYITIIDILWGMILCALTSLFMTILQSRLYF